MRISTGLAAVAVTVFAVGCGSGGRKKSAMGLDPAPGVDVPGEHGGVGCPDSAETSFAVSASTSTYTFRGTVTGASGDGVWYVRGPMGEEVGGGLETAANGSYAKTVPLFCGVNLVKLLWSAAAGCPLLLVYQIDRPTCATADIVLTVSWDAIGDDWELHLIKPGGRINDDATDCTWTSCISTSPDWGMPGNPDDDPHKDIDDVDAYGPENIWLAGPEAGTYTVMVEHWGPGDPMSDGSVILNVAGQTITVDKQDLRPQFVWKVATLTFPGGAVQTFQDVVDCTTSWSGGCTLALP